MSQKSDFDLSQFQTTAASGLDALFEREPQLVTPTKRIRVASIRDLSPFQRISAETLIHKSEKDLWAIKRQGDGSMTIERMFDDNGSPLKL